MSTRMYTSMVAGEDLSSYQYHLVKVDAANSVARQDTAGGNIFGVVDNKPESGENCTVVTNGVTRVFAGGTIAAGNEISVTASGTATAAASGDYIVGTAISAVASGSNFLMLITQAGYKS